MEAGGNKERKNKKRQRKGRKGRKKCKTNKTGNIRINITLRRVRITTVAVEKQ
jgi:hypothetical protein